MNVYVKQALVSAFIAGAVAMSGWKLASLAAYNELDVAMQRLSDKTNRPLSKSEVGTVGASLRDGPG